MFRLIDQARSLRGVATDDVKGIDIKPIHQQRQLDGYLFFLRSSELGHSCGVRVMMAIEFIVAGHGLPRLDAWTDADVHASRERFRAIVASKEGVKPGVYNPPPFIKDLDGFLTSRLSGDEFVEPDPFLLTIAPQDLFKTSAPEILLTLDGTKRRGKVVDYSYRMSNHIVDLVATLERPAESGSFRLLGEGQVSWLIQKRYPDRPMSNFKFNG